MSSPVLLLAMLPMVPTSHAAVPPGGGVPWVFVEDEPGAVSAFALGAHAQLDAGGLRVATRHHPPVDLRFLGQDLTARAAPADPRPLVVNRFLGDPATWRRGQPAHGRAAIDGLYPGIDLELRSAGAHLERVWTVAPGADPRAIRWAWPEASTLVVESSGELRVALRDGQELVETAPVAWQGDGEARVPVAVRYALRPDGAGFEVGTYDPARPLVIDPMILYESVVAAAEDQDGLSLAVDASGTAYVLGQTRGPTGDDALLLRMNPDGSLGALTLFGGTDEEVAARLVLDGDQVVIAGTTRSADFPLVGGLGAPLRGGSDAFVAMFGLGGELRASTLIGGSGAELAGGVAVGAEGVVIAGTTASTDFPVSDDAFQRDLDSACCRDAFVAVLAPDLGAISSATYFGGSDDDGALDVGLAADGALVVAGLTTSADLPVRRAAQPLPGGGMDAWVARFVAGTAVLSSATYLGGDGRDLLADLVVSPGGEITVVGSTRSTDLPTSPDAFQRGPQGGLDAFAARFDAAGILLFSTYVGGSLDDGFASVVLDPRENCLIAGNTWSTDFPGWDEAGMSLTKLLAAGDVVDYSRRLEPPTTTAHGIARDPHGGLYFAATTPAPADVYVGKVVEFRAVRSAELLARSRPVGNAYEVQVGVRVVDVESGGDPAPRVHVWLDVTHPDGRVERVTGISDEQGVAWATLAGEAGTWEVTVVTMGGPHRTFDPAGGELGREFRVP